MHAHLLERRSAALGDVQVLKNAAQLVVCHLWKRDGLV
jgi:hypothetical protein